ncbi:MAG TPA: glycosyltransferase family 4 protein, partial [Thermoanaerobaculia bacterium]|nr:glycosyltransferase family 4 protein [Thermoanaerobaculia bacterium]
PAAFLVHEPAGAPFVMAGAPAFVFSHGLERRGWEAALAQAAASGPPIRARSRLLFPLWRLRQADFSLRRARAVLVLNRDDLSYVLQRYRRRPEDVHLFRNGVYPIPPVMDERTQASPPTLLFMGTWLPRKGVRTLVEAAGILKRQGIVPRFLLAGTGAGEPAVLAQWPEELRPAVSVVPRFTGVEELSLYPRANLFLLPSFFEGQPLALLQAMAAGCCCIASDIAGQRDLIRHRESGLLHPAGDAERLAAAVAECLADPGLQRTLGRNARLAVEGRTWETVARDVAEFLESILGEVAA